MGLISNFSARIACTVRLESQEASSITLYEGRK